MKLRDAGSVEMTPASDNLSCIQPRVTASIRQLVVHTGEVEEKGEHVVSVSAHT